MRPNSNNSIFFIVVPLVLIADLQVLGKRFKRQKDDELDENGPDQFLQPTEMDGPDENLHLIDYPCSFPLISVENFENGCHEHNTYHSPYLCDIQSVLMESERRNLDKVMLKHNFSTCFCTDRDHQCQRHNGSLSVMVALVQHAELMSKLAYEMSQPNGVQREHPEVVIKWQTKADANHHRSLPKPFCTFNGPQTLGNAVKFYARWIRQKWSEALDCDIDLLILIIRSASLTDKLSEKETIPVKEWIGLDYNNAKVNENDFDLLGNINHWNSHESLANRVDKLISNLKIIRHRRMLR